MPSTGKVFAMRNVTNGVVIEVVVNDQIEELFMVPATQVVGIAEGSHVIVEHDIDFGWALAA